MAKVKGSREYRFKVVKYRPLVRVAVATAVFVGFLILGQVAYWVGYKRGMDGQEQVLGDLSAVTSEAQSTRAEYNELQQQLANLRLGADVDQSALAAVRVELAAFKEQVAELQEENKFYRNLMAPSDNKRGLTIGTVEINQSDAPRTYRYKIVVQQLTTQHRVLNGSASLFVVGRSAGVSRVLPLNELDKNVDSTNIKLRFKYFQNIKGELVLPVGFEPEHIELEARSTGKNAVTIKKRYGWFVEQSI